MRVVMFHALLFLCLSIFSFHTLSAPSASARENDRAFINTAYQDQETRFTLTRLAEDPKRYSLVVTEGEERTISGAFSIDQLQILRTIMAEAEKFAMTGEAVGAKDPLTTRFSDKQENAFIVDVEKVGVQSRLYLTLETQIGRATFDAGRVFRTTRRQEGFFFELLSKLESVLPRPPVQSSK